MSGQQARAASVPVGDAGRGQNRRTGPATGSTATLDASAFSMPVQLGKVAGTDRDPIPAAPHVRRLAREIGVDIHGVQGSGPGGRISEDDVKLHAKNALLAAAAAAQAPRGTFVEPELPDFAKWGKTERVSMRGVRRKTAEHLRQAWNTIPHVTQQDRADITELEQLRAKLRAPGRRSRRQDDGDGDRAESLRVSAESLPPVQCVDRHGEGRNHLQAVHQHRRGRGHRSRTAGPGDSRRGQEKYRRAGGGADAALEEGARPQADARRDGRRHIHDHESGRNRRHGIFADRESSRGCDSRACRARGWSRSG